MEQSNFSKGGPSPEQEDGIGVRTRSCSGRITGASEYLTRAQRAKNLAAIHKLKEYKTRSSISELAVDLSNDARRDSIDQSNGNIFSITSGRGSPGKDSPWALLHKNSFITPFDSVSCTNEQVDLPKTDKKEFLWRNIATLSSSIYAILVVVTGGIFTIQEVGNPEYKIYSEVFGCLISLMGLVWVGFLHIDLNRHKKRILKEMHQKVKDSQDSDDGMSMTTECVFNTWKASENADSQPYRFLKGRHSGSFFLKSGMAIFCFGHLIHEGLLLAKTIKTWLHNSGECADVAETLLHSIRPIYSFYQLFIVFKYSNIIIHSFKSLARFGLMHCIATSLCVWFSTIVEDAMRNFPSILREENNNTLRCNTTSNFSESLEPPMEYLYPFTIEFSIILAGVWFVVWQNVGSYHEHSHASHIETKINGTEGNQEITYQSNLVISADCHAANKGLFAGLLCLLASIITIIVFFIAIFSPDYKNVGITVFNVQEISLILISLISVVVAYHKIKKLDVNLHPITFLDDFLLFIPLPFFFINSVLSIMAEVSAQYTSTLRIFIQLFVIINVMSQTPFIIDGLRRCSQSHNLRYEKPAREVITFMIIVNIAMWIVYTFEHKTVGKYLNPEEVYHDSWLFVEHTTVPLMLFYRFHSSVCLADIWKSAYEKGE